MNSFSLLKNSLIRFKSGKYTGKYTSFTPTLLKRVVIYGK